jgi:hypothetical protein
MRTIEEDHMRRIATALILTLVCTAPAIAADELSRKPGLWEVRTSIDGASAPALWCSNASTPQRM